MVFISSEILFTLMPIGAYVLAGGLKFLVNSIRFRSGAFNLIGLGGFPSTHTSIISSAFFSCFIVNNLTSVVHSLSIAITLIVIIDALDLRNRLGAIAIRVNKLSQAEDCTNDKVLRERNGHSIFEIIGGLVVGLIAASATEIIVHYVGGL